MPMDELKKLQQEAAKKFGQKVDVYHSEETKTIVIVPHNVPPTPVTALEIIRY